MSLKTLRKMLEDIFTEVLEDYSIGDILERSDMTEVDVLIWLWYEGRLVIDDAYTKQIEDLANGEENGEDL